MTNNSTGLSIILIGGEITLDSGATIDSRRQLGGDEWDFALRNALGNSEAFWHKAKELTDVLVDQHESPDGWALAWVRKTIQRSKPDGSSARVRTAKFLDHAEQLLDDPALVDDTNQIDTRSSSARYRIVPYYFRFGDLVTRNDPVAFLGGFHTTYDDGADIIGLAPLHYVAFRWPGATLVLPHTPLVKRKADTLLELWQETELRESVRPEGAMRQFRMSPAQLELVEESDRFVAARAAAADVSDTQLHVVGHDLRITHWVDNGVVREAAELEAALAFLRSRYDLSFGLLDLARDNVLRESLLNPEERPAISAEPTPIPGELAEAVARRVAEKEKARETERTQREAIHEQVWPTLSRHGLELSPDHPAGQMYVARFGPTLSGPVGQRSPVMLALEIHKRQANLKLYAVWPIDAIREFLVENSEDIEYLTGYSPEPDTGVVLRLPHRGWTESPDGWRADADVVAACADLLGPRLKPVIAASVRAHHEAFPGSREHERSALEPEAVTASRPKRGLLSRLVRRRSEHGDAG